MICFVVKEEKVTLEYFASKFVWNFSGILRNIRRHFSFRKSACCIFWNQVLKVIFSMHKGSSEKSIISTVLNTYRIVLNNVLVYTLALCSSFGNENCHSIETRTLWSTVSSTPKASGYILSSPVNSPFLFEMLMLSAACSVSWQRFKWTSIYL